MSHDTSTTQCSRRASRLSMACLIRSSTFARWTTHLPYLNMSWWKTSAARVKLSPLSRRWMNPRQSSETDSMASLELAHPTLIDGYFCASGHTVPRRSRTEWKGLDSALRKWLWIVFYFPFPLRGAGRVHRGSRCLNSIILENRDAHTIKLQGGWWVEGGWVEQQR